MSLRLRLHHDPPFLLRKALACFTHFKPRAQPEDANSKDVEVPSFRMQCRDRDPFFPSFPLPPITYTLGRNGAVLTDTVEDSTDPLLHA